MNDLYSWFRYSKKQQDYKMRITLLNQEIEDLESEIETLAIDVANFMDIYQANIGIIRNRVGSKYQATWVFGNIRKSYKKGTSYALKINDFNRLSVEDKQKIKQFIECRDEAFAIEFRRFEMRRQSVNKALQTARSIMAFLEESNNYQLLREQLC